MNIRIHRIQNKEEGKVLMKLKIEEIILKLIIVKNQIEIADDPKKQKIHSRNFNRLTKEIKYIGTIEKHLFKKEEMKNLAKLIKKLNKNEKGKLILKKFYLEEKEEIEKMCENFRKGLSVNEHQKTIEEYGDFLTVKYFLDLLQFCATIKRNYAEYKQIEEWLEEEEDIEKKVKFYPLQEKLDTIIEEEKDDEIEELNE
uniref:Uncharacterized protein n=1 Tax=Meloidogyne enterolobii TaxID=390850 RepID=A0A6V7TSF3_MELEN|nr:unnamed protein product [Meloidogyne enterolobii]